MTRFARARGSKSSNERLPEEATSWQAMRRQLQEAQQQQQEPRKERKGVDFKEDSEVMEKREWAVFDTQPREKKEKTKEKKKKKKKEKKETSVEEVNDKPSVLNVEETGSSLNKRKPDKKENEVKDNPLVEAKKVKKRKADSDEFNTPTLNTNTKKLKRKKSKSHGPIDLGNDSGRHDQKYDNSEAGGKVQPCRKATTEQDNTHFQGRNQKIHKRRKPDEGNTTMFINGVAVQIMKFDGFPVKKEDAIRLKELHQKLISRGIPRDEVKRTMKLERRKAEKALARERKKVCFHCRKPGHNLSECPELNDGKNQNAQGTGICFKCGSTEHTHYECRVNRSEGFQFAKCFVCNEQGHIARQCPDNPRGLYPKGGACRVCGDVTHLKKDCPNLVEEKKEQTITLETMKTGALEALDEDLKQQPQKKASKKQKHIKF